MSDDPFDGPEWAAYAKNAREVLAPMMADSAVAVSLYSGKVDPKMAIETGYMILMDKPIIAVVIPGSKVPKKLALVADEIIEMNPNDPSFKQRMGEAVERLAGKVTE